MVPERKFSLPGIVPAQRRHDRERTRSRSRAPTDPGPGHMAQPTLVLLPGPGHMAISGHESEQHQQDGGEVVEEGEEQQDGDEVVCTGPSSSDGRHGMVSFWIKDNRPGQDPCTKCLEDVTCELQKIVEIHDHYAGGDLPPAMLREISRRHRLAQYHLSSCMTEWENEAIDHLNQEQQSAIMKRMSDLGTGVSALSSIMTRCFPPDP